MNTLGQSCAEAVRLEGEAAMMSKTKREELSYL